MDCRILNIEDIDNLKDNKLIIYGAGKYGSFLYSFLEEKNLAESVISQ